MHKLIYKDIFSKINYKEINKLSLSTIKKNIKINNFSKIKKIFYKKSFINIIYDNYVYLYKINNVDSFYKDNYIIYTIMKMTLSLYDKKNKNIKSDIEEIISFFLTKINLKIIKNNDKKYFYNNEISEKNIEIIASIFFFASSIDNTFRIDFIESTKLYQYGYYLCMSLIFNFIEEKKINTENFCRKLKIKMIINKLLSQITPIFYNDIIIKNNKILQK